MQRRRLEQRFSMLSNERRAAQTYKLNELVRLRASFAVLHISTLPQDRDVSFLHDCEIQASSDVPWQPFQDSL